MPWPFDLNRNALAHLGYQTRDVQSPADIESAKAIVFPGVGCFGNAGMLSQAVPVCRSGVVCGYPSVSDAINVCHMLIHICLCSGCGGAAGRDGSAQGVYQAGSALLRYLSGHANAV